MNSDNDDDDEGSGSTGSQGSGIAYVDFTEGQPLSREDTLTGEKLRQLLSQHKDTHEARVKKQKDLGDERKALKDGKISLQNYRENKLGQGQGMGQHSRFKANPALANKAQFSGIDNQVNPLATENTSEANDKLNNELKNNYDLKFAPRAQPSFNPQPKKG